MVLMSAQGFTHQAISQNTTNLDNNIQINDISNNSGQFRNVMANYNGNQQQAPVQMQVQVNNNTGGPNVGVYVSPVVSTRQAIRPISNKAKTPKIAASNTRNGRPKPKPNPANRIAPKRPAARKPVARPTVAAPVINTPVIQQAVPAANPVVLTNVPSVNPAVQRVVVSEQLINANPTVSAPLTIVATKTSNRMSSGSVASGASGSSAHRKSKRKKHGCLCYAANKKLAKFFAKTRKNHIDPAKCFVWN
jgi:hypothetical protein